MCKYCDGINENKNVPYKNDSEGAMLICKDLFGNSKFVISVIELWKGLFGRPKYAHLLFDVPANYCPWCGKKLE